MRVSYIGITWPFQGHERGSTPLTRSRVLKRHFFEREKMSKVTGYSLWLVPEKGSNADEFLRQLIYKLSLIYKTPAFNPHVTLLPAVEKK